MDICFILSSLWISGGVRVVIQYANRLTAHGHHISFVVPKGTVDAHLEPEIDPRIRIIQTRSTLKDKRNLYQLSRLVWEMALAVPHSDVIIATHTPTTAVSLIAGKLLRRGRLVWFYQDYQEMFEKRPIESWLIHNAMRWHDTVITISDVSVQELRSFSSGNIINVGEGIDVSNIFHPAGKQKLPGDGSSEKKIIFSIADPRPRKGMADFISAYEKVYAANPEVILWMATKQEVDVPTQLPHELLYSPKPEQMARLYSACDIFVSASWYESFGLPPLEAMACGAAVVTTDSRGIHEYAIDGVNCLIVPPKNPDRLAAAILKLLSDPGLAEGLRKNGPATARRFDWEAATDRFENALLAKNTSPRKSN